MVCRIEKILNGKHLVWGKWSTENISIFKAGRSLMQVSF